MHRHAHAHDSEHRHGASREGDRRRLAWTLVIITAYMAAEAIGGWLANSLALLADSGHMLSDAAALGLSLFALWIAQRPPDSSRTYGYHRAEILAALVNASTLVAVSLLIFLEAAHRVANPPEVQGLLMMGIALGGLLVNLAALAILHGGQSGSLNVRGAWLHVLSDTLGSVAAIVSGLLVWRFDWYWVDPVVSVAIGLLVIHSAWQLLKESVAVLMESAPPHLDTEAIRRAMSEPDGVRGVHDLHIWTITSGMVALSAHVVIGHDHSHQDLLKQLRRLLHERFGIDHVTLQLETPDLYQPWPVPGERGA